MALQDYARLAVFVNGSLLSQVTSINHVTEAGNIRIDLLNEGLGGFTPGSGSCTLEIGIVVPAGGPEENFQAICHAREFVDVQVSMGSLDYAGRGKFDTVSLSQSVNASLEGTVSWTGEFAPFE